MIIPCRNTVGEAEERIQWQILHRVGQIQNQILRGGCVQTEVDGACRGVRYASGLDARRQGILLLAILIEPFLRMQLLQIYEETDCQAYLLCTGMHMTTQFMDDSRYNINIIQQ
ncbi:Hypothetical_protein [Hexamita inflata]|uniref:Hypothetical_protein n=1 Tax=Hexamita inflata TaxID=28002 RepID=A0AA86VLC7_9EUKA|nr:Hypothetical protein HINF_LOCUS57648 [Hexamita inflata]